jgi:hypothetical protein
VNVLPRPTTEVTSTPVKDSEEVLVGDVRSTVLHRQWLGGLSDSFSMALCVLKEMKTLFVLNDSPYGVERSYNALRLAGALAKTGP